MGRRAFTGLFCFVLVIGLIPLLSDAVRPLEAQGNLGASNSRATLSGMQVGDEEGEADTRGKGARWKSGTTSVSGLSLEEKRLLLGLKGSSYELLYSEQGERIEQGQYPDQFDWRDYGGDWTTPIRNQGACGACWAFSSLAALETLIDIEENDPSVDMDLSEQFLLSCSEGDCDGWTIAGTLDFLRDMGTPDETCFPYQTDDTVPCDNACPDWQERAHTIMDWGWVPSDVESIKAHLIDYGPLVTGMLIFEDFYSYVSGIYEHQWGIWMGLHAVTIVGYDDEEGYWICKNSWGTGWGEDGWLRIAYGEVGIEDQTAYLDGPQMGNRAPNVPTDPSPPDHSIDISVDADLGWTGGDPDPGDTVTYDVYFGTEMSPPLVSDDQSSTSYDPGGLSYNTKYYWHVIASDNHGASAAGAAWNFTVECEPLPLVHVFYGDLTIGGEPAPAGTVVVTEVAGVEYGSIVTTEIGKYGSSDSCGPKLQVQGDIEEGEDIHFYVDGIEADQTFGFLRGAQTRLDLTAPEAPEAPIVWTFPHGIDRDPTAVFIRHYDGAEASLPTGTEPDELLVVWFYDEAGMEWLYYVPGWGESPLAELLPGKTYIAIVQEACTWMLG